MTLFFADMFVLLIITSVLLFFYGILIWYYRKGWAGTPEFKTVHREGKWTTRVTIIIPARNEQENIVRCLSAIRQQDYPATLIQVIVVNDHSTDETEIRARKFPLQNLMVLNLSDYTDGKVLNSYKKKAIETAISMATGELIVTTDADCVSEPGWISTIVNFRHQENAGFIAAPVRIEYNQSFLSKFQALDFLVLQGITGASVNNRFHNMCNGANMAYEKNLFYAVNGFEGIDELASGDDMLLMQKISDSYPDKIRYLRSKAATVSTLPAFSWNAFFNQRIRWASKSRKYNDKNIRLVLLVVYLLNVFLLVFFVAGLMNALWLLFFLVLVVMKVLVEFAFVHDVAVFFRLKRLLPYFPVFQPLHILYTVIAGFLGLSGSYQWKGRKVK